MIITQITFNAVKRDCDGIETERITDRVYLKMRKETAEDAKKGKMDISLFLALQHIAELQGYSLAGISDITY